MERVGKGTLQMLTAIRDLPGDSLTAILGLVPRIRGCGGGPGRVLPNTPTRPPRTKFALLLFAVMCTFLVADLTCAQSGAAQTGSATLAPEATDRGKTDQASVPAATAEAAEHGLPQKAVEIARSLAQLRVKRGRRG